MTAIWQQTEIERAAEAVGAAEAILIGAGAGMSVDAGIPAYRLNPPDERGVRAAPLGSLSPLLFRTSPELAWGRAGQQLDSFRRTVPHAGYAILLRWARRVESGAFVITSNVDGVFLAAGFPEGRVLEGHGSMHFLQCTTPCTSRIWSAAEVTVRVDSASGFAQAPLPACPDCGGTVRPNVFMFGDASFNGGRVEEQHRCLEAWLEASRGRRFVVVECGAGTAVPTIRNKCHAYARELGATLVRINVDESEADPGAVRIPLRALQALERIDALLA